MTTIDPAILAKLETWLRMVCFQKPTPEAYDLAKDAVAFGYQLCAAEKQAEIAELEEHVAYLRQWSSTLAARIATLEQQRQQDIDVLPGPYYMDPPDGGDVPISEQLKRMAKDAERYRWIRADVAGRDAAASELVIQHGTVNLDKAIDAARAKEPHHD